MQKFNVTENDMKNAFEFADEKAAQTMKLGHTPYQDSFFVIEESPYFQRSLNIVEEMMAEFSSKFGVSSSLSIGLSETFLAGFAAGLLSKEKEGN